MSTGPVRDSPCSFQRWMYRIRPRYSSPLLAAIFVGGFIVLLLIAGHQREGGANIRFLIAWFLGLWIFVWLATYMRRSDRRMSVEERLDQWVYYWPLYVPAFGKRWQIAYLICAIAIVAWLTLQGGQQLVDDGLSLLAAGRLAGQAVLLGFVLAIAIRSLHTRLASREDEAAQE